MGLGAGGEGRFVLALLWGMGVSGWDGEAVGVSGGCERGLGVFGCEGWHGRVGGCVVGFCGGGVAVFAAGFGRGGVGDGDLDAFFEGGFFVPGGW